MSVCIDEGLSPQPPPVTPYCIFLSMKFTKSALLLVLERLSIISSVTSMVGAAASSIVSHTGIERDTIIYPVFITEKCYGCGRCYLSCMDGGHQAIAFDTEKRKPSLIGKKCVGCHLCRLVCPSHAIGMAPKAVRK